VNARAFQCNVCGHPVTLPVEQFHREGGHCPHCGSIVRFRDLIHALAIRLFGSALPIPDFPSRKALVGIGLSDADCYALRLSRRFAYTNYFYHSAPYLDITRVEATLHGTCDFLIASDIFEHVPPPRHVPFENVARILKPGGLLVLSIPYTHLAGTVEYYPDLHDYHVVTVGGRRVLVNLTRDNRVELFDDLFWHGGAGWTLELRVFAKGDILRLLSRAGFQAVQIHEADVAEFGIFHPGQDHSFVISAVRAPVEPQAPSTNEENAWLYPDATRVDHPQVHYPQRVDSLTVVDVLRLLDREAHVDGRLLKELQTLYGSWSWRLTAPLRQLRAAVKHWR
jgi:SAM-dependent methyltransferase